MSSSTTLSTKPPTLAYVSSLDMTSTSNFGSIKYQIIFDPILVSIGNLIMFEYKFQKSDASIPNLDNTSFGFISVENAIQSGISNQYIISIPALANTYDGSVDNTIQFRVYFGITSSSKNVFVSPWSNPLNVYNPPVAPIIYSDASGTGGAYFQPRFNTDTSFNIDASFNTDKLYVLLDPSQNPYDYNLMKFFICYFYQDASNTTIWSVSDPLSAIISTINDKTFRVITVKNIGEVSSTSPYNKVYVSIHAVYDWVDSLNNYYAVSYISNEVTAVEELPNEDVPVLYNIVSNPSTTSTSKDATITGNCVTNNLLKPIGILTFPNTDNTALITIPFLDKGTGVPGVTFSYVIQPNGNYLYSFTIYVYQFFPNGIVPSMCTINTANNAGIGYGNVNPIKP